MRCEMGYANCTVLACCRLSKSNVLGLCLACVTVGSGQNFDSFRRKF